MRIAVVSGHYMPELGYQEVYLSRAFSRLGHTVKVFTTTAVSPTGRSIVKNNYPAGVSLDPKYQYQVERLHAFMALGANVVAFGLKKAMFRFNPDMIIIIGLAKYFGRSLLCKEVCTKIKMVTLFGDSDSYADKSTTGRKIRSYLQRALFFLTKAAMYRKAVRLSDVLVLNHAETRDVFNRYLTKKESPAFLRKSIVLRLGYDPDEFFYSEDDAWEMRKDRNMDQDEIVFVTSTRVTRRKNLEQLIDVMSDLYSEGEKVRYILIGFMGDQYGEELKQYIARQKNPEIFECLPFLDFRKIRKIYCGSDIGIWLKAAISIQQAMGTGMQVILEDTMTVAHLMTSEDSGWMFQKGELQNAARMAINSLSNKSRAEQLQERLLRSEKNCETLSYDNIAREIIESINPVVLPREA